MLESHTFAIALRIPPRPTKYLRRNVNELMDARLRGWQTAVLMSAPVTTPVATAFTPAVLPGNAAPGRALTIEGAELKP